MDSKEQGTYNQDRLISSISVIKEVLQSNMTLRDDLLKMSQDCDFLNQNNYQLKIENEDLRDRLNLLGEDRLQGANIEYMPYIAAGSVEKLCDSINSSEQLKEAKILIFNHMFSLQKENRALHRRLKANDNRSRQKTDMTEQSITLNLHQRPSSFQPLDLQEP